MSSRPRLGSVVADTSALVSLSVPRADAGYGTEEGPDPLQYLVNGCYLEEIARYVSHEPKRDLSSRCR
jgi:hypothetical protein